MRRETYAENIGSPYELGQSILREWLAEIDEDDLADLLTRYNLEEVGWNLFYHKTVSHEEATDQLSTEIQEGDAEVYSRLLEWLVANRPTTDSSSTDRLRFHVATEKTLRVLTASRSSLGVQSAETLATLFGDKTEQVARYFAKADDWTQVQEALIRMLTRSFQTPWETAWLIHAINSREEAQLDERLAGALRNIYLDEMRHPLCRSTSARALARTGRLEERELRRSWSTLPRMFRSDLLLGAISLGSRGADWPERFLEAIRDDPLCNALEKNTRERMRQASENKPT